MEKSKPLKVVGIIAVLLSLCLQTIGKPTRIVSAVAPQSFFSAGAMTEPSILNEVAVNQGIKSGKKSKPTKATKKTAKKKKAKAKKAKKTTAKPKTAYNRPYDTEKIIRYAMTYGESIGMTWNDSLAKNNCAWAAPGATSPIIKGKRLRTAIENSIQRVKKLQTDNGYQPGEFHFKLYLEKIEKGEYKLYFLMG